MHARTWLHHRRTRVACTTFACVSERRAPHLLAHTHARDGSHPRAVSVRCFWQCVAAVLEVGAEPSPGFQLPDAQRALSALLHISEREIGGCSTDPLR